MVTPDLVLQTTQQLKSKAWADVVESLIGCIYLEAGENAAMEFLVYLGIIPEVPIGFEREPTVHIAEVDMDSDQLGADIAAAESAAAALDLSKQAEPAQRGAQAAAPAGAAESSGAAVEAAAAAMAMHDTAAAAISGKAGSSRSADEQEAASKADGNNSNQQHSVSVKPHVNCTADVNPVSTSISSSQNGSRTDVLTQAGRTTQQSFHPTQNSPPATPAGDQIMSTAVGVSDSAVVQSHSGGHPLSTIQALNSITPAAMAVSSRLTVAANAKAVHQASDNSSLAAEQTLKGKGSAQQAQQAQQAEQKSLAVQQASQAVAPEVKQEEGTAAASLQQPQSSDPCAIVISDDDSEQSHGHMQSGYVYQSGYGANSDADDSDSGGSDSAERGNNPEEIAIAEEVVEDYIPVPGSPSPSTLPMEVDPPPIGLPVTMVVATAGDQTIPEQAILGSHPSPREDDAQVKMDAMAFLAMEEDSGDENPAQPTRGQVGSALTWGCHASQLQYCWLLHMAVHFDQKHFRGLDSRLDHCLLHGSI